MQCFNTDKGHLIHRLIPTMAQIPPCRYFMAHWYLFLSLQLQRWSTEKQNPIYILLLIRRNQYLHWLEGTTPTAEVFRYGAPLHYILTWTNKFPSTTKHNCNHHHLIPRTPRRYTETKAIQYSTGTSESQHCNQGSAAGSWANVTPEKVYWTRKAAAAILVGRQKQGNKQNRALEDFTTSSRG